MQPDLQAIQSQAEARLNAGIDAAREGRLDVAAEALVLAESLFRQLDVAEKQGVARAELAEVQRQSGAPLREANATLNLGHLARGTGNLDRARNYYERAARLFAAEQNPRGQAAAALALGHIERQRSHLDGAEEYYKQSSEFARVVNDPFMLADALRGLGES